MAICRLPQFCCVFSLGYLLATIVQIIFFSPISPNALYIPPISSVAAFPANKKLQSVIKLGEGFLENPEDVSVDENGVLYTATRDGWIKRLHRNGSWENWKRVGGGDTLLGISTAKDGGIFVCDAEKGLLKVTKEGVSVLASHVDGTKIRFADDVMKHRMESYISA
ncbi:hypothetical protein SLA2020_354400 [Shorea laevis]